MNQKYSKHPFLVDQRNRAYLRGECELPVQLYGKVWFGINIDLFMPAIAIIATLLTLVSVIVTVVVGLQFFTAFFEGPMPFPDCVPMDDGSLNCETVMPEAFFELFGLNLIVGIAGNAVPIFAVVMILAGQRALKQMRFRNQGKLISARITDVATDIDRKGNLMLKLRYGFKGKDGRAIARWTRRERNDLGNADMPESGDKVAVLYVGDRTFQVL